jgi:hypothetical protein
MSHVSGIFAYAALAATADTSIWQQLVVGSSEVCVHAPSGPSGAAEKHCWSDVSDVSDACDTLGGWCAVLSPKHFAALHVGFEGPSKYKLSGPIVAPKSTQPRSPWLLAYAVLQTMGSLYDLACYTGDAAEMSSLVKLKVPHAADHLGYPVKLGGEASGCFAKCCTKAQKEGREGFLVILLPPAGLLHLLEPGLGGATLHRALENFQTPVELRKGVPWDKWDGVTASIAPMVQSMDEVVERLGRALVAALDSQYVPMRDGARQLRPLIAALGSAKVCSAEPLEEPRTPSPKCAPETAVKVCSGRARPEPTLGDTCHPHRSGPHMPCRASPEPSHYGGAPLALLRPRSPPQGGRAALNLPTKLTTLVAVDVRSRPLHDAPSVLRLPAGAKLRTDPTRSYSMFSSVKTIYQEKDALGISWFRVRPPAGQAWAGSLETAGWLCEQPDGLRGEHVLRVDPAIKDRHGSQLAVVDSLIEHAVGLGLGASSGEWLYVIIPLIVERMLPGTQLMLVTPEALERKQQLMTSVRSRDRFVFKVCL